MNEPVLSLVKVDEQLPELRRKCEAVLTAGKQLVVSSETKAAIGQTLVDLKVALDGLDLWRKGFVDAPNAFVTGVNSRAKELRDPLAELDKHLRKGLAAVIQAEEDAARKERERVMAETRRLEDEARRLVAEGLAAEKALREAQTLGEHGEAHAKVQEVAAQQQVLAAQPPPRPAVLPAGPARRTSLGSGSYGHQMKWGFTVLNLAEVPREYLVLDEAKVQEYIDVGGRKIPGLTILEKPVIRVEKGR